jgi:hypothetical protein
MSIGSSRRASGSSSSGWAFLSGRTPRSRRMPARTAATAAESHGLGSSCARCAAAIAAARLAIVTGRNSRSASAVRTVPTVLRRGGHRPQPARDAPVGEHAPVALVCAPGRRRERRRGVAGGALELPLERRRCGRGSGCWEGVCQASSGSGKRFSIPIRARPAGKRSVRSSGSAA